MDTLSYKGYEIQPAPQQLADTGEWTMNISILRDRGEVLTPLGRVSPKGRGWLAVCAASQQESFRVHAAQDSIRPLA